MKDRDLSHGQECKPASSKCKGDAEQIDFPHLDNPQGKQTSHNTHHELPFFSNFIQLL